MANDQEQELMRFLASSGVLCVLLVTALFYSNEMALALFGVMAYLFGLLSLLLWFLFSSDIVNGRKRTNSVKVSL